MNGCHVKCPEESAYNSTICLKKHTIMSKSYHKLHINYTRHIIFRPQDVCWECFGDNWQNCEIMTILSFWGNLLQPSLIFKCCQHSVRPINYAHVLCCVVFCCGMVLTVLLFTSFAETSVGQEEYTITQVLLRLPWRLWINNHVVYAHIDMGPFC